MMNNLKPQHILSSNWRIITFSLGLVPFLSGWREVLFIHFGENLVLFLIALVVMLILFIYSKIFIKPSVSKERETIELNKENLVHTSSNNKRNTLSKIFGTLFAFLLIITILFFYFLKDATVYYIKVSGNISSKEAYEVKGNLQEKFQKNNKDYFIPTVRRKSTKSKNNNYFVSINGAFLDKEKANKEISEVKNILGKTYPVVLIESKNADLTRKIEYLVAHFIPYKYFSWF